MLYQQEKFWMLYISRVRRTDLKLQRGFPNLNGAMGRYIINFSDILENLSLRWHRNLFNALIRVPPFLAILRC